MEVPEINDGIVEIKAVAGEAGDRSKICVYQDDPDIDAVGSCVGQIGHQIHGIVDELKGEKIDNKEWSHDADVYVSNAHSPSKVIDVLVNEEDKETTVIVPDYQLSLAIGKRGQNARLAAKLTGWKIDIKSETEAKEQGLLPTENEDDTFDLNMDEPIDEDLFE